MRAHRSRAAAVNPTRPRGLVIAGAIALIISYLLMRAYYLSSLTSALPRTPVISVAIAALVEGSARAGGARQAGRTARHQTDHADHRGAVRRPGPREQPGRRSRDRSLGRGADLHSAARITTRRRRRRHDHGGARSRVRGCAAGSCPVARTRVVGNDDAEALPVPDRFAPDASSRAGADRSTRAWKARFRAFARYSVRSNRVGQPLTQQLTQTAHSYVPTQRRRKSVLPVTDRSDRPEAPTVTHREGCPRLGRPTSAVRRAATAPPAGCRSAEPPGGRPCAPAAGSTGSVAAATPLVRVLQVLALVVLVFIGIVGYSVGGALTRPGNDSVSQRVAEWARDHHLGSHRHLARAGPVLARTSPARAARSRSRRSADDQRRRRQPVGGGRTIPHSRAAREAGAARRPGPAGRGQVDRRSC